MLHFLPTSPLRTSLVNDSLMRMIELTRMSPLCAGRGGELWSAASTAQQIKAAPRGPERPARVGNGSFVTQTTTGAAARGGKARGVGAPSCPHLC